MSSTRSFTVFQDAPAEAAQPKVSRPKAMTLRSHRLNMADDGAVGGGEVGAILNKENLDPFTGDRVGAATSAAKKRKVLAAKTVAPSTAPSKVKKPVAGSEQKKRKALTTTSSKTSSTTPSEPEQKKRKALATTSSKAISTAANTIKNVKPKKETKGSTTTKKRTTVKKVSPMPPVNEEDEAEKEKMAQAEIDSRVYDLTVKPLADVSEAYDAADVFGGVSASSRPKFGTFKAASVEPEMRDYCFPPKEVVRRTSVARFRAASEGIPDHQPAFSTPERKKIYAAFTFSSPPRQANGDFV
ncbi:hypothetical protein D9619_008166 [Psilocybe cf. subviscida]|uniref:Uncharacterized protein n=1 Tax=Psilocybe cf. subviscida TaxID=2480587 RepID=A0A8H5ESU6_9AGAR|nr:hypothetical protein D9619_008166 [Psilocybe cf. subviscida]